jgi:hypothetical protein
VAQANGLHQVSWFDCPGGGQIHVEGNTAYIGHIDESVGTSIIDVSDPAYPKLLARIAAPTGYHAHKVRSANGLMLVNRESVVSDAAGRGGLGIYDVSNPGRPREITHWHCDGTGVHRFTFDGRYAYISPEVDGYRGNIVMILDLADPEKPREVGRWWMPGQWIAGGETPTWQRRQHRCHHPIRSGNRLYVSYWHGGHVILDIEDMASPKLVSHFGWSPPYPWPAHSSVPVPFEIYGRRWLICADEDVDRQPAGAALEMAAFLRLVDATDERRPTPVSSFQVADLHGRSHPLMTGCHQPVEVIRGTEIPIAWFAQGLRIVDIANPLAPKEVAYFVPDAPNPSIRVSSNDVFEDDRRLIFLIDRIQGMTVLERT